MSRRMPTGLRGDRVKAARMPYRSGRSPKRRSQREAEEDLGNRRRSHARRKRDRA
jgi:hypothetical protein